MGKTAILVLILSTFVSSSVAHSEEGGGKEEKASAWLLFSPDRKTKAALEASQELLTSSLNRKFTEKEAAAVVIGVIDCMAMRCAENGLG